VGFNLYFTFRFTRIIIYCNKSIAARNTASVQKVNQIAKRSIIHCFTSSMVIVIATYCGPAVDLVFMTVVPLCMHFLFNYKGTEAKVSPAQAKIHIGVAQRNLNFLNHVN